MDAPHGDIHANTGTGKNLSEATPLHDVGAAWAVAQCNATIPARTRMAAETELFYACQRAPDWAATFLAGIAADLAETLPPTDPWVHLAARIENPRGLDMARIAHGVRPAAGTGAWNTHMPGAGADVDRAPHAVTDISTKEHGRGVLGDPFGTIADAADSVSHTVEDNMPVMHLNLDLAPFVQPLSPSAAAILAFASDGWKTCREAIVLVADNAMHDARAHRTSPAHSDTDRALRGTAMCDAGTDAVRWLHARRLAYTGAADAWLYESALAWTWRASRIVDGAPWQPEAVRIMQESAALTADDYPFHIDVDVDIFADADAADKADEELRW